MLMEGAYAAIPATDVERALAFYRDMLGLGATAIDVRLGMYWVGEGSHRFLLYRRDQPTAAQHTVLTFTVPDIDVAQAQLASLGVYFYEQDGAHICPLGESRSAWFEDTEGNALEISQRPAVRAAG